MCDRARNNPCIDATAARILILPGTAGVPLLTFDLVWVAALCVVIAAVAEANSGQLSRRPLERRMA